MRYLLGCAFLTLVCGCSNTPEESGTIEVISFSPAEGTKIDCNTIIQYQLKYHITNPAGGSSTVTAKNNQAEDKTYSATAPDGEISDQISGQKFYTNFLGVKCRKGGVPFSFEFSLNLPNGTKISSKTYMFDEVPGTSCLANTGLC